MPSEAAAASQTRATPRRSPGGIETALGVLILVEIVVFAAAGTNFLTLGNAGEIARASAEVAILALALTPIVLTGGMTDAVFSPPGASVALHFTNLGSVFLNGGQ